MTQYICRHAHARS